jgi:uroporphyrinogen decarboxylase
MNRFVRALRKENPGRPPVWLMRQAGRYHAHYQALRREHSFIDLCKKPEVACEATLGPIRDFGFDAAILFSDLLFPLEAMGMGLTYEEGPKLAWHLRKPADLARLGGGAALAGQLEFQAEALRLIRRALPPEKGLLGFVGGPMTLFYYAAEGSHQGSLGNAREGLEDGRFDGFLERLLDLLAANMALQAGAGADTVAVLDTCAGEVDAETYARRIVPSLAALLERFRALRPGTPVVYYSRGTGPAHWRALEGLPIAGIGIDWRHDLAGVLREHGGRWAIQGNVDPEWIRDLPAVELETRVRGVFERVRALPAECRRGWICGLGHGVLPKTPEENVRLFVRLAHEILAEGGA